MIQFDTKRLLVVVVLAAWIAFTAWGAPWLDGRDASSCTRVSVSHFLAEWVDAARGASRDTCCWILDSIFGVAFRNAFIAFVDVVVTALRVYASVMQALMQCLLDQMFGVTAAPSVAALLFVPFAFGVLWVSIVGAWVYFDNAAATAAR